MKTRNKLEGFLLIALLLLIPFQGIISRSIPLQGTTREPKVVKTLLFNPQAEEEFVIYTHDSFLAWGLPDDYEEIMDTAFYDFGVANNVTVKLILFSGMVDALQTLINQKNNPQADIVIGLDSVLVSEAKNEGVLEPYTEANLANISNSLINDLDPDKYLLPADYGLIALIFDTEYLSLSTDPGLAQLTFEDLITTYAEDLAVQDPTLSSTGINFLLYQLVYYEEILGEDWTEWWKAAKGKVSIDKSWSDSWDRVFSAKEDHMLVSYGTDPAYNAFFNYSYEKNGVLIHGEEATTYGWMQIEGIGIVEGTTKLPLAKDYIDYFLTEKVQSLIATNNWMFPANQEVELPPCYDYAITPENVSVLNHLVSSEYIGENYHSWLSEWERVIYGTGLWWLWVTVSAVLVIIAGVVGVVVYRKRTKLDIE
ncbi:MAG: thiamine ABC transporter substrate-binding protein [Candidatus Heimdallarchaeota archaeon]|nr:thiamine ABC transporter substrate-binding protein [Candidatus Heimdallarchaeota archaeon]